MKAETSPTVLTDSDQRRLRAAMSAMPYAASVPQPWPGTVVDIDAVIAFMEGLATVLSDVSERNEHDRRRLFNLDADVAALRRIIGTSTPEATR